MTTVVCDASPLIFLANLNRLDLVSCVLGGRVFVLQCVADELQTENAGQVERQRLDRFLGTVEIPTFEIEPGPSSALSHSDQSTLRWAIDHDIDYLLADDRLLRRVASAEGLTVIGFIGLLVAAAEREIITASEASDAVEQAIAQHGCRISIALYQRVMKELERIGNCS
jgi:predicted nucleic acid-binding protein